jgi:hypothetical protein
MGLAVKAEWVDADKHLLRNAASHRSHPSHKPRTGERDPPLSTLAGEILGVFASAHRRAGARLRISALHLHHETEPALAAATSELASTGLVRVVDAGTIELTSKGYDLIQAHLLQTRARVFGHAPSP